MNYKFLLFIVFTTCVATAGRAQHLFLTPTVESTIIGLQYGGTIGYKSKKDLTLGAFYLQTKTTSEVWPEPVTTIYGAQTTVPLVRTSRLVFSASIRAGLADNQFVVVIPGAETRIKIFKNLHAVTGFSWRYGNASIQAGAMLQI